MIPNFTNLKSIHVELTDKCNAKCPSCVRRLNGGPLNPIIKNIELGVDYFKNQLGKEFCSKIEFWNFCGTKGDPVASTQLLEIILFLKSCNPDVGFTIHTNGGLRTKTWWGELGKALSNTNSKVVWGIDGLEDTNHIYRRSVIWDILWDNLNAYCDAGGQSIWQFLIFNHNKHQVDQIKQICKEKNIILDIKEPFGFYYNKNLVTNITEIHPIHVYDTDGKFSYSILPHDSSGSDVSIVPIHPDDMIVTYNKTNDITETKETQRSDYSIQCRIGRDTSDLYVDSDGAIIPCCFIGAGIYNSTDKQLAEQFSDRNQFIPNKNNSVYDILKNEYYTKTLIQGILGDLPNGPAYTMKCIETCGKCLK
jgi:hypothetical protein